MNPTKLFLFFTLFIIASLWSSPAMADENAPSLTLEVPDLVLGTSLAFTQPHLPQLLNTELQPPQPGQDRPGQRSRRRWVLPVVLTVSLVLITGFTLGVVFAVQASEANSAISSHHR